MSRRHVAIALLTAVTTVAGCAGTVNTPRVPTTTQATATPTPSGSTPASTPSTPTLGATPGVAATPVLKSSLVLGLDGQPAAGVKITAYLISQDAGTIVAQGAGNIVAQGAGNFHLLDAGTMTATTDAQGRFALAIPGGQQANIEAALSTDVKAISLGVTSSQQDALQMKLDYCGTITGKITSPGVSDLTGVDVYIPGTSYAAKTDQGGNYTITNVPAGTFKLHAEKTGLGVVDKAGVTVTPKGTVTVPDLVPALALASITSFDPPVGTVGGQVVIKGANFGAAAKTPFTVTVGGVAVTNPQRAEQGDTITITVPPTATGGDVVVSLNGVAGTPTKLPVVTGFQLTGAEPYLLVGGKLTLAPTLQGTTGADLSKAAVAWSSDSPNVTVDATGTLTGVAAGNAKVTATSGTLTQSVDVTVYAESFVTTLAGQLRPSFPLLTAANTKDGTGTAARFARPMGLVQAKDGTMYVSDYQDDVIRKITPDFQVTMLAGKAGLSYLDDHTLDGKGDAARFDGPMGMAIDAAGNLYVADSHNNAIRKVAPDGTVSTLAGHCDPAGQAPGKLNFRNGALADALFCRPTSLALDPKANALYVADNGNNLIRKIDLDARTVSTAAGIEPDSNPPQGMTNAGYFNGPLTSAMVGGVRTLAFNAQGQLFFGGGTPGTVRTFDPHDAAPTVTTLAGPAPGAGGGSNLGAGKDGTGADATFDLPVAMTIAADGTLYLSDGFSALRSVSPSGTVTTLAGTDNGVGSDGLDGLATKARFGQVGGILLTSSGSIVVADDLGALRELVRK